MQAYHNGLFDSALVSFERALSFSPDQPLFKEWLGRSYHRLGLDSTALSLWREITRAGAGSALLQQRIDVIDARQGLERERTSRERYVLGESLKGIFDEYTLFTRPLGLEPWPDGSYFVASFTGNEVYRFNLNGALQQTLQGGVLGFSQPFDVLRYDSDTIYISEFGADRIAYGRPDGGGLKRFGSSGNGPGELSGPQYLARDAAGYLYVSEMGNRRISKFSPEGEFILSFGRRSEGFPGFRAAAGVAVREGRVYVADSRRGRIYAFDTSGNYLFEAGEGSLESPEGLSLLEEGSIMVADGERLLLFDTELRSFELLSDFTGDGRRIIDAVQDVNGNILISDFKRNEIGVLSELSAMYSGVFVEIERVDADGFPEVFMDVAVHDRLGNPIVGLRESNFILSEAYGLPGSPALLAQADAIEGLEVAVVIERSAYTAGREEELVGGLEDLIRNLPSGSRLRLYTAGDLPQLAQPAGRSSQSYLEAVRLAPPAAGVRFALPEALRMAAMELAPLRGRKLIVCLGSGRMPIISQESEAPSVSVLANMMRTNGIRLAYVSLDRQTELSMSAPQLEYLAGESGGGSYSLYRPAGIGPLMDEYARKPTGRYYLKIISQRDPDYGNRYLPIEVEVSYYNRTGRDELGYYAAPPYN